MAYEATGRALTPEQTARLVALAAHVDLAPGPGGARITPLHAVSLPVEHECRAILDGLFDPWVGYFSMEPDRVLTVASFVILAPSRQIGGHTDAPIRGRRFHVPLAVNAGCWSFHGGVWQQLTVGTVYEMDPTVVHGAVNWGTTTRLHLIVDTPES